MEYGKLGNTDIEVSKLCVGCMSFGKAGTMHDWTLDEAESENVIKHALDLGYNFFDTANGYSAGTSEEYLGKALKKNVARNQVVIASKVYFNEGRLSRQAIMREIDGTLSRLGTDYLDLYIIHRFDYDTPIEETMEALHDLVKQERSGHLVHLPCMDIIQIVKRVAELAEKYNCKMAQIAIAWQWAKGILSPIIGATKTQYLDDSAGAFDIKLTAEDLAYLEEPYVPHEIVGAIDKNPAQGVILLDEKK